MAAISGAHVILSSIAHFQGWSCEAEYFEGID